MSNGTVAPSILWLASYPKSGNTWLRFLCCNLLFGPQTSAQSLMQLAPDLHELPADFTPPPHPLLLKTHFPYAVSLPLRQHSAAAIYIVRHPADAMLSNFHYSKRAASAGTANSGETDRAALDAYVEQFIVSGGDPRWLRLGMGSWRQNVRSWIGQSLPFPVLWLRYEDVLSDTKTQAKRILAFCGVEREESQIDQAVAAASFKQMRAIEEADIKSQQVGIFYKPYLSPSIEQGLRFMRSGSAGEAERILTSEQKRRLSDVFGEDMLALGYQLRDA